MIKTGHCKKWLKKLCCYEYSMIYLQYAWRNRIVPNVKYNLQFCTLPYIYLVRKWVKPHTVGTSNFCKVVPGWGIFFGGVIFHSKKGGREESKRLTGHLFSSPETQLTFSQCVTTAQHTLKRKGLCIVCPEMGIKSVEIKLNLLLYPKSSCFSDMAELVHITLN